MSVGRAVVKIGVLAAAGYAVLMAVENMSSTVQELGEKRIAEARAKTCETWKATDAKEPTAESKRKVQEYCNPAP